MTLPLLSELIVHNWGNPHWTIDELAQWLRETMNRYDATKSEEDPCQELEDLVKKKIELTPNALRDQIVSGDAAALVLAMRSAQTIGVGPGWLRDAACAAMAEPEGTPRPRRGRNSSLTARMESIHVAYRTACVYYLSIIANEDYGRRWPAIEITAKAENVSTDAVKKRLQMAKRYGINVAFKDELTG